MLARHIRALVVLVLVAVGALAFASPGGASPGAGGGHPAGGAAAHYDHLFVIVEENHGFSDVIGNPAAPNLNALAREYGLATAYYGVTHPSEPNYVAMFGGSTFGVKDDNPYYLNRVDKPSLISQLDHAGIGWKAYLQGLPHPGYQGICYPANCNGAPDKDPLYVSKHNPIPNFSTSLNAGDWSRQVPVEQLTTDLRRGSVPTFNFVVPDECHDQHGDPPYCVDSGSAGDPQDQRLVATGDRYLGELVSTITGASFWAKGNNAVAIVYDEGNDNAGIGGNPGGGRAATVVVTSHGPRKLQDPTPYNHYSLLQTIQRNFGLGCLENSCDTAHVAPMNPLLAVTGARASATKPVSVPSYATPSPTPAEPVSYVTNTPTSAGWTVQAAPKLGTADNTFGAVSAVSPTDVWAVGNFLPDTAAANPDATLTMAAHFDGSRWTSTPTPNTGPNYNTLFGVAAVPGKAWAVGVSLDGGYNAHSLIEAWDGSAWHVAATPRLDTSRDILSAVTAVSGNDVWAVGERQDRRTGRFASLVEHWDGQHWSVVASPDPGATGNHLYGVAAAGPRDVWAVGQRNGTASDEPLVEHWDGRRWSVVSVPTAGTTGAVLTGVAVRNGEVWAVGQTDDAAHQGHPLVEHLRNGAWSATTPSGIGSAFTNLTGVTVADRTVWTAGTSFDSATGLQKALIARYDEAGWHTVDAPNPGAGDNVFGAIAATGDDVWAVGYDKTGSGRDPLIEHHHGD
ncbi:MAG TPA: alkaline phosphatase family protein [Planosporangium sp.]|nr:alkaline phosphatase family protein [Planosporangium sp.]